MRVFAAALMLAATVGPIAAHAQPADPSKPVRVVVGFPPGAGNALFKMHTGAPIVYVRYKSSTEAVTAPAGTPTPIMNKLEDETIRVVKSPDVRARMAALRVTPEGTTSSEFSHRISQEVDQWSAVAKANNIKMEQ